MSREWPESVDETWDDEPAEYEPVIYRLPEETSWQPAAGRRVGTDARLEPYYHLLVEYEWHEGDAHWRWVASAPVAELLDWAKCVAKYAAQEGE